MQQMFADVEYKGFVYFDAEFIKGKWYFESGDGIFQPFFTQEAVKLVTKPQNHRRHAPHESGHAIPLSSYVPQPDRRRS
jgi:hypothetical protein